MEHTENKVLDEATRSSYWQAHFDRWRASGRTQPDYCQEHALSVHKFKYWRQKLGQAKQKKRKSLKLVPITKATSTHKVKEVKKDLKMHIAADGVSLEVSVDVDPTILKGIIKALRGNHVAY